MPKDGTFKNLTKNPETGVWTWEGKNHQASQNMEDNLWIKNNENGTLTVSSDDGLTSEIIPANKLTEWRNKQKLQKTDVEAFDLEIAKLASQETILIEKLGANHAQLVSAKKARFEKLSASTGGRRYSEMMGGYDAWTCAKCGEINTFSRSTCLNCGVKRKIRKNNK